MGQRIKIRRDTSANWAAINPILLDGEIGYDKTIKQKKVGDGVTPWNSLAFGMAANGLTMGAICSVTSAANATVTTPHGLGRLPDFHIAHLQCLVAVNGYAVGDIVDFKATNAHLIAVSVDAVNSKITCTNSAASLTMIPKGGGANVTTAIHANFKIVLKTFKIGN